MPEVRPFRGVRYDIARVGTLADVVAPPYDVIDAKLQDHLYNCSPHNIIRMELNREEASDTESENRYTRASRFLREWIRDGVLHADDQPAYYVYQQTFEVEGKSYVRKGFFARIRLEPFGEGRIYPHEQTLAGPKADRLSLYKATGFNLSPIFGLYPDPDQSIQKAVEAGIQDSTPLEATDHLGVVNRLWVVKDPKTHTVVQGLLADKAIFIADGHHRYETGLKYRDELAASGEISGPDDPANFCLMMLVGMSDPGLIILPTHRLVSGFTGITSDQLAERLTSEFEVTRVGTGENACHETWKTIEESGDQDLLGFGTVADGAWILARLRSDAAMDRLAPEHSPDWRSLGVSILHELVLRDRLGDLGKASCRYVHLLADVAVKGCDIACLVPPARMDHVETIASNLETMPPKSTYFYPKLLSGLVLNPLR